MFAIYAAEFDIIKGTKIFFYYKKGCIIKSAYPQQDHDESLLASYMIPDGVHKVKKDHFFFKLHKPQIEFKTTFKIHQSLTLNELTFIQTQQTEQFNDYTQVSENFIVNDQQAAIVNLNQQYFLTVLRNKKDPQIKRGSLIRSIAISSNDLVYVGIVHDKLEEFLDIYFEQVGIEHWDNPEFEQSNKEKLDKILYQAYQYFNNNEINNLYYKFSFNLIDWNFKDWNQLYDKRLEGLTLNSSVIEFIKVFKMKTRIIYRAILQQKRIVIISHECSNNEKNYQESIYSRASNLATSMIFLVQPYNILQFVQGYKSLMDPDWDQQNNWISIVSNPIFEYRKEWWDLFVDINTQKIIESNPQQSLYVNNEQDVDFFQNLIQLINEQHITEIQVRQILYRYTSHILRTENNKQYLIYQSYEKMMLRADKMEEGQLYQISQILEFFKLSKELSDYNLLTIYNSLNDIIHQDNYKQFFRLFIQAGFNLNILGTGLLCSDTHVRNSCKEFIKKINNLDKTILKKLNIMLVL